ncbi:MAG: EAL domain-containing protein [Candidatus Sedimenticola endophacoides]
MSQNLSRGSDTLARLSSLCADNTLHIELQEGLEKEIEFPRQRGVQLLIDNYGSGDISLRMLGDLPPLTLKFAYRLIHAIDADPVRQKMVRAIAGATHGLGLKVSATGVEREAEAATLLELGCDSAQGFLFSKPLDG